MVTAVFLQPLQKGTIMSKRIIAIFLCLVMLLGAFTGCSGNGSTTANAAEQWLGEQMLLYPNGDITFRIIRSAEATNEVIQYAAKIKSEIKERLDITAEYKPDTVVEKEGLIEVLVGETNRKGYKEIYDDIVNHREKHRYDWTIKMVDNKIFIVGGSNVGLEMAVDYFIEMFCSTLGTIITSEYCYKYKHDMSNSFTINGSADIDGYKIVMPKYNLSYIVGRELDGIVNAIDRYNGNQIEIVTDREKKADKEIIISANTDRGSVANLTDKDAWQISVKDGKIYIEGGYNYSNAIAVLEFVKHIKEGKALKDGDVIKGKYSETIKNYDDSYYRLTLSDDFDDGYDEKIWDSPVENLSTAYGGAFGYDQILRPENNYVEDGKFVGFASYDTQKKEFYGTRLTSENKVWLKYGFVEMSAIIPSGGGFWSSFWLLGPQSGDHIEVDIFEQFSIGSQLKQSILHHGSSWTSTVWAMNNLVEKNTMPDQHQKTYYFVPEGEDLSDTYHTIGFEWDENSCRFTMDGRVLYEMDYSADEALKKAFQQYHRMRIGLTVGHSNDDSHKGTRPAENTPDSEFVDRVAPVDLNGAYWKETNKYIIEYVHVFQSAGQTIKFRQ